MNKATALLRLVVITILLSTSACGGGLTGYWAAPIDGVVVDQETKQPLSNVYIVARWTLKAVVSMEGNTVGNLQIEEAVTDSQGRYHFSSWGPKWSMNGRLSRDVPLLIYYRPGYVPRILANDYLPPNLSLQNPLAFKFNASTVQLIPFKGSLDEYVNKQYADSIIGVAYDNIDDGHATCDWERIPQFTTQMLKLRDRIEKEKLLTSLPYLSRLHYEYDNGASKCRALREVLSEYKNE